MKRVIGLLTLFIGVGSLLTPLPAAAQAPQLINYQGRLLNGTNLVNGNIGISLRLFNLPSGGSSIYEDSNSVTVADGLYSTFIGDNTTSGSLTAALTNAAVYIEVAVNGIALSPRERVGAVAYSMLANGVGVGAITTAMLADGAVTSNKLSANAVTASSLADGSVSGAKIASNSITTANVADGGLLAQDFATAPRLSGPLSIPNPAPGSGDYFGNSVAAVGTDRFVVGAYWDDAGAIDAGCVYLYDTSGALLATVTNPVPEAGDFFGISVAGVGTDRFVVGAHFDEVGANNAVGSAYLYNQNGILLVTLTNPSPAAFEYFGFSVAGVGSNRIVVGAYGDSAGAANAGSAYLYDLNGTLLATITNPAPTANDNFGWSVAAVGPNRFVVGANADDAGAANAGSAYLYDLNGTLLTTITNPTPAVGDEFGYSIAGVGPDRFLVGAYSDDAGATDAGAAYLYDVNGILLATITNPAPVAGDSFGNSVAGVGLDRFIVGALYKDAGATNAGSAYLYSLNGTLLATITNPAPVAEDYFGWSVAGVGANRFVVGAPYFDAGTNLNAGRSYLYSFTSVVTGLVAESIAPGNLDVGGTFRINGGTTYSRMQSGTFGVGTSPTSYKVVTNVFPVAFSSVPGFVANAVNEPGTDWPDVYSITVRRITTTNFVLNIQRVDLNNSWGQNLSISWHAWE